MGCWHHTYQLDSLCHSYVPLADCVSESEIIAHEDSNSHSRTFSSECKFESKSAAESEVLEKTYW